MTTHGDFLRELLRAERSSSARATLGNRFAARATTSISPNERLHQIPQKSPQEVNLVGRRGQGFGAIGAMRGCFGHGR